MGEGKIIPERSVGYYSIGVEIIKKSMGIREPGSCRIGRRTKEIGGTISTTKGNNIG